MFRPVHERRREVGIGSWERGERALSVTACHRREVFRGDQREMGSAVGARTALAAGVPGHYLSFDGLDNQRENAWKAAFSGMLRIL